MKFLVLLLLFVSLNTQSAVRFNPRTNFWEGNICMNNFDFYDIIGGRPYIVKADEMDSNEVIKVRHAYDLERIGDYVILTLGGYRN